MIRLAQRLSSQFGEGKILERVKLIFLICLISDNQLTSKSGKKIKWLDSELQCFSFGDYERFPPIVENGTVFHEMIQFTKRTKSLMLHRLPLAPSFKTP